MLYLLLFLSLLTIIYRWEYIIPVYVCLSLWINIEIKLGSISFINLFIFLSFIISITIYRKKLLFKSKYDKLVIAFILYCFCSNIPTLLFASFMKIEDQFSIVRSYLFYVIVYLLWRVDYNNKKWDRFVSIFVICSFVICFYGLFCYYTKTNYLVNALSSYYNSSVDILNRSDAQMDDGRLGLVGRIIGTASYSIPYAILMVMWFYFIGSLKIFVRKKIYILALFLVLTNLYLTGSRGAMFSLLAGISIFCFIIVPPRKRRLFLLLMIIVYFLLPLSTLFDEYNNVGGSTTDMRSAQLLASWDMISLDLNTIVFGHGLGYAAYYIDTYGVYTDVHSFESVLFSSLVNTGIYGLLFIFIGQIIFMWKIANIMYVKGMISSRNYYYLCSMLFVHFLYSIIVGDSYGLLFYSLFFILLKRFIIDRRKDYSYNVVSKLDAK